MGDARTRRVPRTTLRLVLLATLVTLLAGCIKFDMDLTVSSDDTLSGTMVMALDRDLMEMGGGGEFPVDDMMAEGDTPFAGDADVEGVSVEPYDHDGYVGQQFAFDGVPLAVLNEESADPAGDSLRIVRDGDVFRVSGGFDMTTGTEALEGSEDLGELGGGDLGMDPSAFFGGAELRIRLTFPGEVLESNGVVEGNTVTWDLEMGETNELAATARADTGLTMDDLLVYGLVGVVALATILVVVLVRRGDRAIDAEAESAAAARTPEEVGAPLSAREVAAREEAGGSARAGEWSAPAQQVPADVGAPAPVRSRPRSDAPDPGPASSTAPTSAGVPPPSPAATAEPPAPPPASPPPPPPASPPPPPPAPGHD